MSEQKEDRLIVYVRAAGVLVPLGYALVKELAAILQDPFGGSVEEMLAEADANWGKVLARDKDEAGALPSTTAAPDRTNG